MCLFLHFLCDPFVLPFSQKESSVSLRRLNLTRKSQSGSRDSITHANSYYSYKQEIQRSEIFKYLPEVGECFLPRYQIKETVLNTVNGLGKPKLRCALKYDRFITPERTVSV